MKRIWLTGILGLLMISTSVAQLPAYNWGFSLGNQFYDYLGDIKSDSFGMVYITGMFGDVMDMDPGPGTHLLGTSGLPTGFLAKYSPEGKLIWALGWIGKGGTIEIDKQNNVVLAGAFSNKMTIGGIELTSNGWDDIFLASFNPQGKTNWAFSLGGVEPDLPGGIAIGPAGGIYLCGRSKEAIDFDPGTGTFILTGLGLADGFFARYTPQGELVWAKMLTTSAFEESARIEVDNNGLVYVGGTFYITLDFDLGTATTELTPKGIHDHYIAVYDTSGNFKWVKQFGGIGNSSILSMGLGDNWNGNPAIIATGNFLDSFCIGQNTEFGKKGLVDIYVIAFDNAGNKLMNFQFGDTAAICYAGQTLVDGNDLILSGSFSGTVDLDPRANKESFYTSYAQKDIFIARYNNDLSPQSFDLWNGVGEEYIGPLTFDPAKNILAGFRFNDTLYMEPNTFNDTAFFHGGIDFSIVKLGNAKLPTGIEQIQEKNSLVYPVPAKDYLKIQINGMEIVDYVLVCDVLGRNIQIPWKNEPGSIVLDCHNLEPGYYIVSWQEGKIRKQAKWLKL
jgi:Secretion system C-terminal sorting domain